MGKMVTGIVFDIRKYSIHDGPGIRTAVFFKGCPLDCRWCHNPEGKSFKPELLLRPARCITCGSCIEACQPDAIDDHIQTDRSRCIACGKCTLVCPSEARELTGREVTVDAVLAEVESDRVFYERSGGGVTFTGGEPLSQPRFFLALLSACRERGLHIVLDTSGFASRKVLEEVHPFVDLFLYDVKLMDEARHRQWTGVSNRSILSNLEYLSRLGREIQVRIPLVPGVNDDEENLRQVGAFLSGLTRVPSVHVLPYHNLSEAKYAGLGLKYDMTGYLPPTNEDLLRCSSILKDYGIQVLP